VAERKDVLSTLFLMLALTAYSACVRKPGVARYALVAVWFACGLMSKPMLVTLPLLLLVVDWWPLRRPLFLREKIPLAILSALSCAATVWAQHRGGTIAATDQLPLVLRLSNAAASYLRYIGMTLWPTHLAVFYPFPETIPLWASAGSALVLAAISCLVYRWRKQRPWLAAGWCWYLLTLLPVIGLIQVGMQAMADRYLYVPMTGLLIGLVWEVSTRLPARLSEVAAGLAAAACAVLTFQQVQVWKDGATLFAHAIAVTDDNFVAHDNLGVELDRQGRSDEALLQYREAIRIRPGDRHAEENYAQSNFAAAEWLFRQGKLDQSLILFREGLRHRPRQALAHSFAGLILTQQHQLDAAIEEFHVALDINPALAGAHLGLGVALAWSQKPAEAVREFQESLRYDSSSVEAYYDLGLMQASLGQPAQALQSFDAALRLKPDFEPASQARAELMGRAPKPR
jgi:Tfp pilus assembly protein PilF